MRRAKPTRFTGSHVTPTTPVRTVAEVLQAHPQRNFFLLATFLVVSLYWRTLSAPFLYDDLDQVVNNPNLISFHDFARRFLLHPVALATALLPFPASIYRPVFWLSLFLDRALWGLHSAGFHVTNLVLHVLNGNLAFALLRRLKVPVFTAGAIALLWLALPVNTEVVAWTSARSYELCTLFCLASLLAALAFFRRPRSLSLIACFLATCAALLSHELGTVTLPLLVLLGFFPQRRSVKALLPPVAASFLAFVLMAGLRTYIGVHTFSAVAQPRWTVLSFAEYLALTFVPVHLSVERSTSLAPTQGHPGLVLLFALLCAAIACGVYFRRTSPLPLAGLLWFLLCIAPFTLLMNYQGTAERFAYLASLGLVAAFVGFLAAFSGSRLPPGLSAVFVAWSVCILVRTGMRAADWADPLALYEESLVATPQSALLHFNLGYSLREQGRLEEAGEQYRKALQLNPNYPKAYASLGDVYLALHNDSDAQASYRLALAQDPADPQILLNSGTAYQDAGDLPNAEATWRRLLALAPASSAAHTNLGVLYLKQRRQNEAMHQFAMAIDLHTKDPTPYYDLGVLFQQAGRSDLALVLYKKVLELAPNDEDTLRNLQVMQQNH